MFIPEKIRKLVKMPNKPNSISFKAKNHANSTCCQSFNPLVAVFQAIHCKYFLLSSKEGEGL